MAFVSWDMEPRQLLHCPLEDCHLDAMVYGVVLTLLLDKCHGEAFGFAI